MGDVTVDALRGVNLRLPAGRFVILVGPSGSGKTTLLNLAGGLDTPSRGNLAVFGRALSGMNEEQLTAYRREKVGFVFQMFNLVPTLTALENIRLVAQLVGTDDLAPQTLADVGLADRADNLPSQLSGGEQQRVAIARALVKQPDILLADEPTGALDFETGRQVLSVLWQQTRSRGMTVIMVTHNVVLARMADLVIRLRSGEVIGMEPGEAVPPSEIAP
ncbi:MAG: ABC transporter ATP-binding protein [Armatimonadota bacterium]|nr:MAG: ABC transporter ATP-binding protein [Armatimonadota bacterium]